MIQILDRIFDGNKSKYIIISVVIVLIVSSSAAGMSNLDMETYSDNPESMDKKQNSYNFMYSSHQYISSIIYENRLALSLDQLSVDMPTISPSDTYNKPHDISPGDNRSSAPLISQTTTVTSVTLDSFEQDYYAVNLDAGDKLNITADFGRTLGVSITLGYTGPGTDGGVRVGRSESHISANMVAEESGRHYIIIESFTSENAEYTLSTEPISTQNPARFNVSNLSAPTSLPIGENFTVSADIENVGDISGQQDVQFRLGGDVIDSQIVSLNAGQTEHISTTTDITEFAPGTHTYGVFTNYSDQTDTIDILESNNLPTALISTTPTNPKTDESITFDGSESSDPDGLISNYEWSIDGTNKTGKTVSHAFDETGQYTVELTVTDSDGATATETTTLEVVRGTADFNNQKGKNDQDTAVPDDDDRGGLPVLNHFGSDSGTVLLGLGAGILSILGGGGYLAYRRRDDKQPD